MSYERTVLLLRCPDRPRVVATVAAAIADAGGNIVHADQHLDAAHDFFVQRVEFDLPAGAHERFGDDLRAVADRLSMTWDLWRPGEGPNRVAILVSQPGHCLVDLLGRVALGELHAEIACVISNHDSLRTLVEAHGHRFHHVEVGDGPDAAAAHEQAVGSLVEDSGAELVVLARYMRILPAEFVERHVTINVHHSFLPAFSGARPYHQAYSRGVKLIGATAHYATPELDAGPIICQQVTPVTHRDDVDDLRRIGSDLERLVLARAVHLHLERRVVTYANRTVVFD
ncbi:MAG: formyltetrahydrofolate deformylase [Acidimicrobiia bacterium]|nr:formyltetrahydrofolate deformylase [Acidimicrobiia bacterium]